MSAATDDPKLTQWSDSQPPELAGDPIWQPVLVPTAAQLLRAGCSNLRAGCSNLRAGCSNLRAGCSNLRAGCSIAANVAEGYGRPTSPDRLRYLSIALGSLRETQTWYQACGLALPPETVRARLVRLSVLRRLLLGLISHLRKKSGARFDTW